MGGLCRPLRAVCLRCPHDRPPAADHRVRGARAPMADPRGRQIERPVRRKEISPPPERRKRRVTTVYKYEIVCDGSSVSFISAPEPVPAGRCPTTPNIAKA